MIRNMVYLLALVCSLMLSAFANPIESDYQRYEEHKQYKQIPILQQHFQQHHGGFEHSFESGNGIHVHEHAYYKESADKKHETLVQQGVITYHDEHGHPISLSYIADENGFQPQGDHLPTPPPIPIEIAKGLEHLTVHHEEVLPVSNYYEPQHEHY